jgi:hypothetical protein
MAIVKWRVGPNQAIKTIENWKKGAYFWLKLEKRFDRLLEIDLRGR